MTLRGMKKTPWTNEVLRNLAESQFYARCKLAARPSRSILTWKEELLANCSIVSSPSGGDELDSGEWAGRYLFGRWRKTTGYHWFSTPKPYRLKAIHAELDKDNFVPTVALEEHRGSIELAVRIAKLEGFDQFGDVRILAGAVHGIFYGLRICERAAIESIVILLRLKGETLWRLREVRAVFRFGWDNDRDLAERVKSCVPHYYRIRDGFAAFGTNFGAFFNVRDMFGRTTGFSVSGFSFRAKGRRVKSFTASALHDGADSIQYHMHRSVDEIERCIELMHNYDGDAKGGPAPVLLTA
jgi:hypothetical protein